MKPIINGVARDFMSRTVNPADKEPFTAAAVLGIDFARAAFTMTAADDDAARFNVAVYADTPEQAELVVLAEGFKDIRDVTQHAYM